MPPFLEISLPTDDLVVRVEALVVADEDFPEVVVSAAYVDGVPTVDFPFTDLLSLSSFRIVVESEVELSSS